MNRLLLCIVFDNNLVIVLKIHLEDLLVSCHLTDSVPRPRPRRDPTMDGRADVSSAETVAFNGACKSKTGKSARVTGPAGLPKSINAG